MPGHQHRRRRGVLFRFAHQRRIRQHLHLYQDAFLRVAGRAIFRAAVCGQSGHHAGGGQAAME
ncbi:MAG: hypothetical protein IPM27_03895 [Nitrosomonadales bacterium]|nr:hypothetical protein [Nitrosomonadales bacterium]